MLNGRAREDVASRSGRIRHNAHFMSGAVWDGRRQARGTCCEAQQVDAVVTGQILDGGDRRDVEAS